MYLKVFYGYNYKIRGYQIFFVFYVYVAQAVEYVYEGYRSKVRVRRGKV